MTKKFILAFFFLLCLNNNHIKDSVSQSDINFAKDLDCLSLNVYHESRGEPEAGKRGVAQVTLNRTKDSRFPSTVCAVVYQQNGKVHQFSWTSEPHKKITDTVAWQECVEVARKALTQVNVHPLIATTNALYYKAVYSKSKWHKKFIVATIGNHTFYTAI